MARPVVSIFRASIRGRTMDPIEPTGPNDARTHLVGGPAASAGSRMPPLTADKLNLFVCIVPLPANEVALGAAVVESRRWRLIASKHGQSCDTYRSDCFRS